jgi:DNA-binding transcriptional MerR regulator
VLPPAARTASGRRLYDAARVARLELVATLRELGLGLADVRRVLAGQASIAEVAAVHLDALDAQIRALRLHRAVLAVVVKRAAGNEEMTLMNKLARMSVAERRQMIEDFLAEVFQGLEPDPAGAPRWAPAPNLPDGPSPEQADTRVELAELVSDRSFRQRIRQVTGYGIQMQADDGLLDWGLGAGERHGGSRGSRRRHARTRAASQASASGALSSTVMWPASGTIRDSAAGQRAASHWPCTHGTILSFAPCMIRAGTRMESGRNPHGCTAARVSSRNPSLPCSMA